LGEKTEKLPKRNDFSKTFSYFLVWLGYDELTKNSDYPIEASFEKRFNHETSSLVYYFEN